MNKLVLQGCIVAIAVVVSGCLFGQNDPPKPSALAGRATYGDIAYLAGAEVLAASNTTGRTSKATTTDELGNYSFLSLPEDTYQVTVTAMGESESWTVDLKNNAVFDPTLPLPMGFDRDYFRAIANIRPFIGDGFGGVEEFPWDMPTRRWRTGRTVLVWYDTDYLISPGAESQCTGDWESIVGEKLNYFAAVLDGALTFAETDNLDDARIAVVCVQDGELGPGVVGYAPAWTGYDLASDPQGTAFDVPLDSLYTELAFLYVVGSHSGDRTVITHEMAHVIGLGHVDRTNSMLYPYLGPGMPAHLSAMEETYAQMLYSIPSGKIVSETGSVAKGLSGLDGALTGGSALVVRSSGAIEIEESISVPHGMLRLLEQR